jgi:ribosome-associated protein
MPFVNNHEGMDEAGKDMVEFKLEGREFIELNDLLKVTGLCDSGGTAKTAIAEGRVTVDGHVELRRRCKLRPGQIVKFEGRTIVVR